MWVRVNVYKLYKLMEIKNIEYWGIKLYWGREDKLIKGKEKELIEK